MIVRIKHVRRVVGHGLARAVGVGGLEAELVLPQARGQRGRSCPARLQQPAGWSSPLVEALQDADGLPHGGKAGLGLTHGLRVQCRLGGAQLGSLHQPLLVLRDLRAQRCDVHGQLRRLRGRDGLILVDGLRLADRVVALTDGLADPFVAELLVAGLGQGVSLQARDEVCHELAHLDEGVLLSAALRRLLGRLDAQADHGEHRAVQALRRGAEQSHGLRAPVRLPTAAAPAELQEARRLLMRLQVVELLVRAPIRRRAGLERLDCRGERLQLLGPSPGALVPEGRLLLALGLEHTHELFVGGLGPGLHVLGLDRRGLLR
mmetsp:Transcript_2047/g.5384  ORF Transcript_2047/g.5384 Transcript_2047/m.5384 type:complete len:319 (+) Transcript_2047:524-1480(+)